MFTTCCNNISMNVSPYIIFLSFVRFLRQTSIIPLTSIDPVLFVFGMECFYYLETELLSCFYNQFNWTLGLLSEGFNNKFIALIFTAAL
jgi:hypothetical protein